MAKVKGICRNEDCIKLNEIQEVEKSEFVCPECGGPLIPFGSGSDDGKNPISQINIDIVKNRDGVTGYVEMEYNKRQS